MRTTIAIVGWLAMAGAACAQTVVDGSDANIPEPMLAAIKAEVGKSLADPLSAQIRGLKASENPKMDGGACGEINAKNLRGAYTGFFPFSYIPTMKRPLQMTGTEQSPELRATLVKIHQALCSAAPR